ncbi:PTS sugar transporter subunit IIA [Streptomyces sp. TS71-3]|uniref:PTS sugar transporter subunit IIA n=1 Tax=Streptomyces sp. TS71-3 TaxID=2733862 RepID=UPI001B190C64|nr:PTS sugar transporter subunit IIA [Streptomyces sp. TS71-3]GHJ42388.1 PTS sugar transporter [Streptomyces sp. TS71-3]
MAELTELLAAEAIRLDGRVNDWREAITAAGDLMVATGVCADAYTADMIQNVVENGPYVVIAPGFAFAHARPSPAVLKTGMSWLRLAEPVEFGHESNDPVELVVALAARDAGAHTAAMAALARLLADPGLAQALRDVSTPQALLAVLGAASRAQAAPSPAKETAGPGEARGGAATDPGGDGAAASLATAASAPAVGDEETGGTADGRAARSGGNEEPRPTGTGGGGAPHKILTVCGNGLGTSLFLKNTVEQVLDRWGWLPYVTVEATDTVSARGKASEAVAILTSGEIARTLGDIGVPVKVVSDFTSTAEADRVLRDTYDV